MGMKEGGGGGGGEVVNQSLKYNLLLREAYKDAVFINA